MMTVLASPWCSGHHEVVAVKAIVSQADGLWISAHVVFPHRSWRTVLLTIMMTALDWVLVSPGVGPAALATMKG